jgi:hypothetical protein
MCKESNGFCTDKYCVIMGPIETHKFSEITITICVCGDK